MGRNPGGIALIGINITNHTAVLMPLIAFLPLEFFWMFTTPNIG